jgi:hypothetical protein
MNLAMRIAGFAALAAPELALAHARAAISDIDTFCEVSR